jgi:hypothetical protein
VALATAFEKNVSLLGSPNFLYAEYLPSAEILASINHNTLVDFNRLDAMRHWLNRTLPGKTRCHFHQCEGEACRK